MQTIRTSRKKHKKTVSGGTSGHAVTSATATRKNRFFDMGSYRSPDRPDKQHISSAISEDSCQTWPPTVRQSISLPNDWCCGDEECRNDCLHNAAPDNHWGFVQNVVMPKSFRLILALFSNTPQSCLRKQHCGLVLSVSH